MTAHFRRYDSPIGPMLMRSDGSALSGLWFFGARHFPENHVESMDSNISGIFDKASEWLDCYFDGRIPGFLPPIHLSGSSFQMMIWQELMKIPYGKTCTYEAVAESIGKRTAVRAAGHAIGKNPISIIIPCHRVIGANGRLTGYDAGTDIKKYLLDLERRADSYRKYL